MTDPRSDRVVEDVKIPRSIIERASDAFWAVISESFPDTYKSCDGLGLNANFAWQQACQAAVKSWLANNSIPWPPTHLTEQGVVLLAAVELVEARRSSSTNLVKAERAFDVAVDSLLAARQKTDLRRNYTQLTNITQGEIEHLYSLDQRAGLVKSLVHAMDYINANPRDGFFDQWRTMELFLDALKNAIDGRATGEEWRTVRWARSSDAAI